MEKTRIEAVREKVEPKLREKLAESGLALGNPAFIRVVKENPELELWLRPKGEKKYKLWKTWPVAAMSGKLGPKEKQGDLQAPEGFYSVDLAALNPKSLYHLSFNLGYPNAFDREHQRTGDFLMVHGNKVSIGCFAMTDPVIEEIYLVVEAALRAGQREVPVHAFPFRMTEERMAEAAESEKEAKWLEFWQDLRVAWDKFETETIPPKVKVVKKRYVVEKGVK